MRIFGLMLYSYLVLRRRREEGDLFDFWQMNYLVDLDVFGTNDKKLPGWYRQVVGTTRRVIAAGELLAEPWCQEASSSNRRRKPSRSRALAVRNTGSTM